MVPRIMLRKSTANSYVQDDVVTLQRHGGNISIHPNLIALPGACRMRSYVRTHAKTRFKFEKLKSGTALLSGSKSFVYLSVCAKRCIIQRIQRYFFRGGSNRTPALGEVGIDFLELGIREPTLWKSAIQAVVVAFRGPQAVRSSLSNTSVTAVRTRGFLPPACACARRAPNSSKPTVSFYAAVCL